MTRLTLDAQTRFAVVSCEWGADIREFREKHQLDESFDTEVRRNWNEGFAKTLTSKVYDLLNRELGPRREIAEFFGLKDPTSISENKANGTLTNSQVWTVIFEYRSEFIRIISDPELEVSAQLNGYLHAVSHARRRLQSIENGAQFVNLDIKSLDLLHQLLSTRDWLNASRESDEEQLEQIAMRLLFESTDRGPPGDGVVQLQKLMKEWGMAFLLCVDSLGQ